ncbi:hypothetical protein ACTVNK_22135, partial [Serratia nevei]
AIAAGAPISHCVFPLSILIKIITPHRYINNAIAINPAAIKIALIVRLNSDKFASSSYSRSNGK